MKKIVFHTFSLKQHLLSFVFLLFTICLVFFSSSNIAAAKNGLSLWVNSVVPSLFPFFVATELLSHTSIIPFLGKKLTKLMRPLFHIPGEGSFALLMGILSGYPVGAKIVTGFRKDGICTKEEGERMLAFTNNSGPLFILGTVGITLFSDTAIGLLLLVTHILACLSVGFIFRFWKYKKKETAALSSSSSITSKETCTFSNLGEVLSNSIKQAISTVVMIGGFVVLFSVILSILKQSHVLQALTKLITPIASLIHLDPSFITPFLNGFLELTNGVKEIAAISYPAISVNIILCAFLLGFGGISVLLQVWSIAAKSDLSILPYFFGKLLQGFLAALYTYLAFRIFPFLNLDIVPTVASQTTNHSTTPIGLLLLLFFLIFSVFFWKKRTIFTHKKQKRRINYQKGV